MLQRMRNFCLLMLPLLFLAGMLYLQGKSLPAAAPAVIPALGLPAGVNHWEGGKSRQLEFLAFKDTCSGLLSLGYFRDIGILLILP